MTEPELTKLVSSIIRAHAPTRRFHPLARKSAIKCGLGNMHLGDQQQFEAVKSALLQLSKRRGRE